MRQPLLYDEPPRNPTGNIQRQRRGIAFLPRPLTLYFSIQMTPEKQQQTRKQASPDACSFILLYYSLPKHYKKQRISKIRCFSLTLNRKLYSRQALKCLKCPSKWMRRCLSTGFAKEKYSGGLTFWSAGLARAFTLFGSLAHLRPFAVLAGGSFTHLRHFAIFAGRTAVHPAAGRTAVH